MELVNPAAGSLGYAIAAIASLLLLILLSLGWRGRAHGMRLIAASGVSACWAITMYLDTALQLPSFVGAWSDAARTVAWLAVLLAVGREALPRGIMRLTKAFMSLLVLASVAIAVLPAPLLSSARKDLILVGLCSSVLMLVLLEQIFRNSGPGARWSLKYLVFGLGGIYAFDLYLFAEASLFNAFVEGTWQARGFINALLLPMVLIAARRNPGWKLDVFISRQVTFYTGTIMAAGIYVLLMAAGGFEVRRYGGQWAGALQAIFLVAASLLLLLLVFSGSVRRRTRVFFTKHFYRNKYDYRVEWLRFVKTLSDRAEQGVPATSVRAVADIFGSPGGVLYVRDDAGRNLVPSGWWPLEDQRRNNMGSIDLDHPLAAYLSQSGWIVDLAEHRSSADNYDNLPLPEAIATRRELRLLAPLILSGALIGLLVLDEPPAPFKLTYEDRDLLKTVCQHVATHIAQHLADQRLSENRQFEAHGRLTAFMMHDLKNSVAQLQLLVANSARHRQDPEFLDDAISTAGNVVERITRLIQQLNAGAAAAGVSRATELSPLLEEATQRCSDRRPVPTLKLDAGPVIVNCDAQRMAAIVEHVVRNAQDATGEDGRVVVHCSASADRACIEVRDTGCGMNPDFVRQQLFRPFASTKGAKGMGIGAYQVREYARELGGDVEVMSTAGQGTRFSIILPIAVAQT